MTWLEGNPMMGMWILWTLALVLMVLAAWFVSRGWSHADRTAHTGEPSQRLARGKVARRE